MIPHQPASSGSLTTRQLNPAKEQRLLHHVQGHDQGGLGSIGFNATKRKEMSRVTNEPQKILNTAAKAIALH